MAYWFHRNPLKATSQVNFDLKMISALPESISICSQLKQHRSKLIEYFSDPSSDANLVETAVTDYLSLLLGFIDALDSRGGDSSKLRHYIRFKWTQSMLGNTPVVQQDAIFEVVSICQELSIWLMKHSALIAAKEEIKMEEAKDVHKCLRKAAGVLKTIQPEYYDRLLEKPEPGSDLDPRVTSAYILQNTAEAQEVTIARAIELKHSSSLISALAHETSNTFLAAAASVKALDTEKFGKWMRYFQFKSAFYEAYAYCYLGENLLSLEKCGEAIRALQESENCYETATIRCKEYTKMKGPGISAKPEQHLFFRKLKPLITRTKDKCERENGLIFHQRVPQDLPALELKATHGLVTPEDFKIPSVSNLWTPAAYSAFDLTKPINPKDPANSKAAASAEGPLPSVVEKQTPESSKDPKTQSGCSLQ